MIDKDIVNEIRSNIDIVEIISNYIPLTKRGKNYFGVCPFHDDNNPSMSVSSDKQIYTCFSCGATGNVFNFVMNYENISFREALKILSVKAGIHIDVGQAREVDNKYKHLYEIYELSQKFYLNNLNSSDGKEAKEYLHNRDLDDEIIKEFQIGLSLNKRDLLIKLLSKKGYKEEEIIKSGLALENNYGLNDIYHNRIMFPLWDNKGNIVGFSGRIYNSTDSSKYINTKETEIFKKGLILYNYHRAKDECRINKRIIIMEGFMDVIRAHIVGIKNVVATMGTAVTKEQASLIKRLAKEVILCFDGDEAGSKATLACSLELEKIGVIPKVVRLEENLDPDEYIKKYGAEQFNRKLDNAISIIDFKMQVQKNKYNFSNSQELSEYLHNIIEELIKIDDDILREVTINKLNKETGIDIKVIKNNLEKRLNDKPVTIVDVPKKIKEKYDKYVKAEQYLLFYMFISKEVVKKYIRSIVFMPTEKYRLLAKEISYFYKTNGYVSIADLISQNNDSELLKTINEIECLELRDNYSDEEIDDYIKVIEEFNVNFEINRLRNEMKNVVDVALKNQLFNRILELKKRGHSND